MSCHDEVTARLAGKVDQLDAWAEFIEFACATGVPAEAIASEILDDIFWEELRERLGALDTADRALIRTVRGRQQSDVAAIVDVVKKARAERQHKAAAPKP